MVDIDIAIEGSSELPQLARLSPRDQIFITAFVRSHGSIKEYGANLRRKLPNHKIAHDMHRQRFEFVKINPAPRSPRSSSAGRERISLRKMPSAK